MIDKFTDFFRKNLGLLRKEGTFARNLAVTTLGSGLGYMIGFLMTPVIARIYEPEAYGEFAVFNTLVANIALVVTLNYQSTFVLSKSKDVLSHLIKLSCLGVLIISLITALVFYFLELIL